MDFFPIAVHPTAPTCSSYSKRGPFSQHHLPCPIAWGLTGRDSLFCCGADGQTRELLPQKLSFPRRDSAVTVMLKGFVNDHRHLPSSPRRVHSRDNMSGSFIALGSAGISPCPPTSPTAMLLLPNRPQPRKCVVKAMSG